MTNNNYEITAKEVIDAIEAIPLEETTWDSVYESYVIFYNNFQELKVSSAGNVSLNNNFLMTLDDSYIEELFKKIRTYYGYKKSAKALESFRKFCKKDTTKDN